jgi:hypothetical protein
MPRTDRASRAGRGAADQADVRDLIPRGVQSRILAEIRQRPARSIAIALGAGYLAGGGIGTILTARLLAMGARIALRLAVVPLLADGVERALFPSREPDSNNLQRPPSKQGNQKEMNT